MGLFTRIAEWRNKKCRADSGQPMASLARRCHFEHLEQRQLLDADPVIAGLTYLEGDLGQDTTPDYFEVSFDGGSETTRMTQFVINGDQDLSGTLSDGDMFFDVSASFPGAGGHHGFQFDAARSIGVSADDILSHSVSDDGLVLTVNVRDFVAGDRLSFTIDVDEVERLRTDKIASGVEFEGSYFKALFVDEHYDFAKLELQTQVTLEQGATQLQQIGVFYDEYDQLFELGASVSGSTLDLYADNQLGQANRTAAALDAYGLTPKPVSISGNVYHDENLNCEKDAGESGIENVLITLQQFNEQNGLYETVATTTTDVDGRYEFGFDLGLMPGQYRLIESQPTGFLDAGASVGTVQGVSSGTAMSNPGEGANILTDIEIPLGANIAENYDFKEVRPATLQGNVYHDRNDDGVRNAGEEGLANVQVLVRRVSGNESSIDDPFIDFQPITVRTDASGRYEVTGLPPGVYEVLEISNYPAGQNPLAGFLDGKDALGNVGSVPSGSQANDRFNDVRLGAGDHGVEYNFGELRPVSIDGYVSVSTPDGICLDPSDPNHEGIAGVEIQLFDVQGNLVASTLTNQDGHYRFDQLAPGAYSIVEVQPDGYFDGAESVGTINGQQVGLSPVDDRFVGVVLQSGEQGTLYNFCEHAPATISGRVHADINGNCLFDPGTGDELLEGVRVQLLDITGSVVAETVTDGQGRYSFNHLRAGEYSLREFTPEGYLDGSATVGQVDGFDVGSVDGALLTGINIGWGQDGVNYDFCEQIPKADVCGYVWHDLNNDGLFDSGELGISGVAIELYDAQGALVASTTTNGQGRYCFNDLVSGEYRIVEVQPDGFVDGKDHLGSIDGLAVGQSENDQFVNVRLQGGQSGDNYNFGELKVATLQGYVHLDPNDNCVFDSSAGERGLSNVLIQLVNQNGVVVGQTLTNGEGHYAFNDLLPGTYSIRQVQPEGYFTGGEQIGLVDGKAGPGDASNANLISGIAIQSGQNLEQYNFCEQGPAEIRGRVWEDGPVLRTEDGLAPSNYRQLRDGVYAEGLDTPISGVRLTLWYYIDPTTDEISPRPVTLADVLPGFYSNVEGGAESPIWVESGPDGRYVFAGLKEGNYIVLEEQPAGFVDANDTAGSTSGFTYNSEVAGSLAPSAVLRTFSGTQIMDSIVNVRVNWGATSIDNNFSEVRVERDTGIDDPRVPPRPETPGRLPPPLPPRAPGFALAGAMPIDGPTLLYTGRGISVNVSTGVVPYTWHLSVVNGGMPRGGEVDGHEPTWRQASALSDQDWTRFDMHAGRWTFTTHDADGSLTINPAEVYFGMIDGQPVAGDFDGDGDDEVVVYHDGYWLIDINGSGRWDANDLMARLGGSEERPVVGDWDGDGKDDIGVFGPIWEGDTEAIEAEPGLPDRGNQFQGRPKNMPPVIVDADSGARIMRLSSFGKSRIDVIDHVFGYGVETDHPVVGDWNGDGIRTIGVFRGGRWHLDADGNGELDHRDPRFAFGQNGDIPLVGDFNGDGVDEVAVYRAGTWIIDTNGDRQLDASDKVFEMGGQDDSPVVGDWNGDGRDEPGLYRSAGVQANRALQ